HELDAPHGPPLHRPGPPRARGGSRPPNVVQEVGETPYPTTTLHATRPPSLRPPRRLRDRLNVGARLRRARWEATRRAHAAVLSDLLQTAAPGGDRKSTRLNSSHVKISYAVFCLKKKNKSRNLEGRGPNTIEVT